MGRVILDNIVKRYRDVIAVDNVSLTVEEGEFVALVGPSGCGKTTTLNLIAGLLELSGGNIYIGERLVNDLDPKDRDIAMVFQNYALYPNKSVYKNLAFPLQMRKMPKAEIDTRVRETASLLGLDVLLDRRPKELSGGQQQRVALGRALVRNPQVFLMDEPLSNLDAKLRVQMRAELKRFHQDINATIVYVTHDQLEAVTMADKMAVMSGGLLQQYDAPDMVYNHPVNTFVAGFVGSPAMNLLGANVEVDGGATWLRNADRWAYPLDEKRAAIVRAASSGSVIAGLRHNAIHLHQTEREDAIPVRVYTVEPTGDITYVHGYLGDQLIVASVPPHMHLAPDDIVWATFDLPQMHLFDGVTQQTLAQ
ncbi:MAG TPA: ABC transporter ATP-binding protein [Thermomicrobiales bacterium]|nr:ABC transporter ATP-binding protein [Thermomicrobiales bacterium]